MLLLTALDDCAEHAPHDGRADDHLRFPTRVELLIPVKSPVKQQLTRP